MAKKIEHTQSGGNGGEDRAPAGSKKADAEGFG
jgi:hypothetical protein